MNYNPTPLQFDDTTNAVLMHLGQYADRCTMNDFELMCIFLFLHPGGLRNDIRGVHRDDVVKLEMGECHLFGKPDGDHLVVCIPTENLGAPITVFPVDKDGVILDDGYEFRPMHGNMPLCRKAVHKYLHAA